MAHKSQRSENVRAPEAVVAYAHNLFELQTTKSGKKQYGCSFLWPKNVDISVLENLALSAATAAWGDKAAQWIKDGLIKSPFLDGDGKQAVNKKTGERHAGFAGHRFIRCISGEKFKPQVVDRKRMPLYEASDVPSGSRVLPVVNAFTWENDEQGKGLSFGVSAVQVVRKATGEEILGGRGGVDTDEIFEVIDDEGDAPESTKTGAGASGLFG